MEATARDIQLPGTCINGNVGICLVCKGNSIPGLCILLTFLFLYMFSLDDNEGRIANMKTRNVGVLSNQLSLRFNIFCICIL